MGRTAPDDRLSKISTAWPDLNAAHSGVLPAQCRILERYAGAVHHYLLAATRDPHAADDLGQEFALRFVRGDFHQAAPHRGRFRDFVKAVLRNLAADHYRRRANTPQRLDGHDPAGGDGEAADREFVVGWRAELLDRAWEKLEEWAVAGGRKHYAVLRWRAENPDRPLDDGLAAVGSGLSADTFRQTLHRARAKYVELLKDEVAFSLGTADPDQVAAELADLGLLAYCE